ncbi:MAG: hypothetical protein AAGI22_15265 [Planctomycetota bacterium]
MTKVVDDPRNDRAEAYERVGAWPEAAALWAEIYFASGTRDRDAGFAAARASLAAGRSSEARALLDDLDARGPGEARVLELRGAAHEALGAPDAARVDYVAALEIDADRPRSLARLGALQIAAGEVDEGLESLEKSIELDPANARAQLDLGLAAAAAGDRERAIRALDVAFQSDEPTDEERLEAARRIGADPDVAPWLAPVVRRDPQHTEALWRLGAALRAGIEPGRGLEFLRRAAESDPGDVAALVAYAGGLVADGLVEDARAILEHARSLELTEEETALVDEVAGQLADAESAGPDDS